MAVQFEELSEVCYHALKMNFGRCKLPVCGLGFLWFYLFIYSFSVQFLSPHLVV